MSNVAKTTFFSRLIFLATKGQGRAALDIFGLKLNSDDVRLATADIAWAYRRNNRFFPAAWLGVVFDRTLAGKPQASVVGRLDHAGIAAENVGESAGSDMIMIASDIVRMTITDIKSLVAFCFTGHFA